MSFRARLSESSGSRVRSPSNFGGIVASSLGSRVIRKNMPRYVQDQRVRGPGIGQQHGGEESCRDQDGSDGDRTSHEPFQDVGEAGLVNVASDTTRG
jgi:hypothetical protein